MNYLLDTNVISELISKQPINNATKPLTSTEFTVLGTLHRHSFQEAEIAPVVLYEKGKYTSLYFVFREEELESQTAKQIRQILQDIETFWFYRKHSLVGRLGVTAIIPKKDLTSVMTKDRGVIYLPSYRIVASGRWLESTTEKGGIRWALSRPIPQPFWPQKRLTDDQVVSLDKLSISIMESLAIQIAGKTKKGISHIKLQNAFANRWNRDTLIMDLDRDGLFEVYVKFACDIGWGEPSLKLPLVVGFLATWENGWKTNYRFGYIGSHYQKRIAEGDDPFFFHPYGVGDVNGDGIAEVISPAEKGTALYEVQKRNLIKILDIQNFPIGLLQ
jgi:predicted nucleic acid-binding protein